MNCSARQILGRATGPFRFHLNLDGVPRFILDGDDRPLPSNGGQDDSTIGRDAGGPNRTAEPAPLNDLVGRGKIGTIVGQCLQQANEGRLGAGKTE